MFQRANLSMSSAGVGEVSTIFQPRRSRAPSIVLTEDQQSHATFVNPVQVVLDNSACEQQQVCSVSGGCGDSTSSCRSLETTGSNVAGGGGGGGSGGGGGVSGGGQGHPHSQTQQSQSHPNAPTVAYQSRQNNTSACYTSCCAESAKKIYFGVCVTIFVTASWVGATHCIKYLYFYKPKSPSYSSTGNTTGNTSDVGPHHQQIVLPYDAPFFTTWFCTNWVVLYFPVYFVCRAVSMKCANPSEIIAESLRGYRDKGFTVARFLIRCGLFCGLWVLTNYMYIHSLRILLATDVMALFATNVCCVYLLSWVILHEQFVGVRIVAVILCDTGIALLAYMDGITGSPTLGGVVLSAAAAAGSAVYKVLFKRVIGETTFGQVSLFFSLIGLCNAALLWPVCLILCMSGAETVQWTRLPWAALLSASILHLVANMLGNFSIALTYDLFITLGLITAVPVSAALDVVLYGAHFMGMKLAGIILIAVGFFLVMFPDNWPDYITRLLRTSPGTQYQHQHHQRCRTTGRVHRAAMQPRQYRLRNYGVSTAHGDGQTLLPPTNGTNSNGNGHRHHQTSGTMPGQPGSANLIHQRYNNAPQPSSSPSQSSHSDTQTRRLPTSTSTSTSSTATVVVNNHRRSHQQDGVGDTDTSPVARLAM